MIKTKKSLLIFVFAILSLWNISCSDDCDIKLSQYTYSIEVSEITERSACVAITPAVTEQRYFCGVYLATSLEGLEDSEIIRKLSDVDATTLQLHSFTGRQKLMLDTLQGATKYMVVAFALDTSTGQPVSRKTFQTAESTTKDLGPGANCYIVSEKGQYSFIPLHVSGKPIERIDKVDWIWTTKVADREEQLLLSDVHYDGSKVYLTTTGEEGNAIIAGFDKDGTIVWVWHIWCTDPPKTMQYENGAVFMDRNLGATSADPSEGKATWGLVWQWGRPTPFFAGYEETEWEKENVFTECVRWTILNPKYLKKWQVETKAVDLATAIAHPTTFYFEDKSCDWHYPIDLTLWGGVKTDYDPSPAGFHIPQVSQWEELMNKVPSEDMSGFYYSFNGKSSWWPASGSGREFDTGCNIIGKGGIFVWSSTAEYFTDPVLGFNNAPMAYRLTYQIPADFMFTKTMGNRSFAHAIRCVAD